MFWEERMYTFVRKKKIVKITHYHYTSGVSIALRKLHLNVELHLELESSWGPTQTIQSETLGTGPTDLHFKNHSGAEPLL